MHSLDIYESIVYLYDFQGKFPLLFGIPIKGTFDLIKPLNGKITNTSYKIFNFTTITNFSFA